MSEEAREADQLEGVAPPETRSLVGHGEAFSGLLGALESGRLPGAVLLSGPRGIGKATFAFTLAREVLARTGDEPAHRVAAQIEALSHPNLVLLRRGRDGGKFATAIRVDEVRAARDALHRTRGRAGYRIAIVDAVDDCNAASANALLKTLEEPPPETLFLVLSHRPGGLLPTIRSRCRAVALRGLPPADVRAVLRRDRPDLDQEALARAVAFADGRPRRGFEMLTLLEGEALDALLAWLEAPQAAPAGTHLAIAEKLAAGAGPELGFAQDAIRDWIAAEAKRAATGEGRLWLASANGLWEKANAHFADADTYNLDKRQMLILVLDTIRRHAGKFAVPEQA